MICRECKEYEELLKLQKGLLKSYMDIDIDLKDGADLVEEDMRCEGCGTLIKKGEYYVYEDYIEEIINEIKQLIVNEVEEHIESCEECGHGNFMNEFKHNIENTFDEEDDNPDEMYEQFNSSSELGDLVENISDWGDDINEEVIGEISCPNCQNGSGPNYSEKINYGTFDRWTTVYTKEDINEFNERFYGDKKTYTQIELEINNIAQVCTYQEIVALKEEYKKDRRLSNNQTLERIECLVRDLYKRNETYIIDDFYTLYRTRINETNNIFGKDDMWEPPMEVTTHGRYNPVGLPILYLANSKNVIKSEVKKKDSEYYNIGLYKIKNPLKCFRINKVFPYGFEGFINEEVPQDKENVLFKVQYIITNIMGAIIKDVGYNGVAYISTKDDRYINFALLNYEKEKDIEILDIIQE